MNLKRSLRIFSLILAAVLLLSGNVLAADYAGAEEAIRQGFATGAEEISLEEYNITIDELHDLFYGMRNDNELPWYADTYSYRYNQGSDIATALLPTNLDPAVYDRNKYEQAVAQVLEEAVLPGMSQWQIALSVHDYLAAHFRYDETYTYYKGYDLLVGETAVCEGYARAYMDILKRAGLDAIYATSESMDHGWNLVKLNGNWYHVDVTWDDPISDYYGRVRHHYFLLDDNAISDEEHEHYDWVTSQTADSDDMNTGKFWHDIDSQICYESASVSYLRKSDGTQTWIYRRDESSGALTELASIDEGYIDLGEGSSYHYENYGLSLWNGRLYFSDMENVYSINTDGSELTTVYTHDAQTQGCFIQGSFVDDGMIYITLNDHDRELNQSLEVPIPGATVHEHDYQPQRTEPTCTDNGFILYVCSCGSSYQGETLNALGHSYDSGTVTREPSGDADGEMTYTCTLCGESCTEVIPATGSQDTSDSTPTTVSPTVPETRPTVDPKPAKKDGPPIFLLIVIGVLVVALIGAILLMVLVSKRKPAKPARKAPQPRPSGGNDYGYGYGDSGDSGYGSDSYGSSGGNYDSGYGDSGYGSDSYGGDSGYGSDSYGGDSGYGSDSYGGDSYGGDYGGGYDDSYSGGDYNDY